MHNSIPPAKALTAEIKALLSEKNAGYTEYQERKWRANKLLTVKRTITFAIPWWDGTLIGCFESYNLMHIANADNNLLNAIDYFPGVSILGCKFDDGYVENDTIEIVASCGNYIMEKQIGR